jgi:hypothetical protein
MGQVRVRRTAFHLGVIFGSLNRTVSNLVQRYDAKSHIHNADWGKIRRDDPFTEQKQATRVAQG